MTPGTKLCWKEKMNDQREMEAWRSFYVHYVKKVEEENEKMRRELYEETPPHRKYPIYDFVMNGSEDDIVKRGKSPWYEKFIVICDIKCTSSVIIHDYFNVYLVGDSKWTTDEIDLGTVRISFNKEEYCDEIMKFLGPIMERFGQTFYVQKISK
jgi:hypothetical protein